MGKVMVIAGEVSGDMHAARVVREIKKIKPATSFLGMGSDSLRNEGVRIAVDPTAISTIGFFEALSNLQEHRRHLKMMKRLMEEEKPDVLFLVDYSGFNMMMARAARKQGIPAVNYFSPSAWVWGRWRARWMARNNTVIASVFPMEAEVYRMSGAEVHFVGHPLVDLVRADEEPAEIFDRLELDPEKPVIGLLPGSRKQEIEKLLPEMLKVAERLQDENSDYQFVLPLAVGIKKEKIASMVANYRLVLKIVTDYTYQLMKVATLLITASGTATLEAAIFERPMIIVYQTGWTTYQLAKKMVQVDHIGLPNIIASREIVPELLQKEASAEGIYQETKRLLENKILQKEIRLELSRIRSRLGAPGAVKRTAELVLKTGDLL